MASKMQQMLDSYEVQVVGPLRAGLREAEAQRDEAQEALRQYPSASYSPYEMQVVLNRHKTELDAQRGLAEALAERIDCSDGLGEHKCHPPCLTYELWSVRGDQEWALGVLERLLTVRTPSPIYEEEQAALDEARGVVSELRARRALAGEPRCKDCEDTGVVNVGVGPLISGGPYCSCLAGKEARVVAEPETCGVAFKHRSHTWAGVPCPGVAEPEREGAQR